MGKDPYRSKQKTFDQKMKGSVSYTSAAMQRGKDLEPQVRDWYCKNHQIIEPKVVQSDEYEWMFASLDGITADLKTIVEIKNPGEKVYAEIKSGKIPEYYIWQGQHQMVASKHRGCPRSHIVFLVSDGELPPLHFAVDADKKMQEALIEEEGKFFECMKTFTLPEGIIEAVFREDKDWEEAAKEWLKAKEALSLAEEYEAICRDSIKYLCGKNSSRGCGISAHRYMMQGRIDYSKVPELKELDIEKYRKPASEAWKIIPSP